MLIGCLVSGFFIIGVETAGVAGELGKVIIGVEVSDAAAGLGGCTSGIAI